MTQIEIALHNVNESRLAPAAPPHWWLVDLHVEFKRKIKEENRVTEGEKGTPC